MSEQETIVIDGRKATDVVRTIMGVGGLVALVLGYLGGQRVDFTGN